MKSTVITMFGLYTINQDETAVVLTLGNYTSSVGPGLGFAVPILQTVIKTKASIQTIDLPDQKIVLEGNIAVKISGSVNFRVANPKRAILDVEDYQYSLRQLALTTISDVLGTKSIEQVRSGKQALASEIEAIISETASKWGLAEVDIRLTDAEMDDSLLRAMMRETEAQKEANATLIKAEADKKVAAVFAEAAKKLADSPGSMTLRILQAMTDMSNNKSTVIIPLPMDFLTALSNGATGMTSGGGRQIEYRTSTVTETSEGPKSKCPYCGQSYKVGNVLGSSKFDEDPEVPGVQLRCKKCTQVFTLGPVS